MNKQQKIEQADDALLTTVEAAREELRCHPQTLVNWRSVGQGPPYLHVGRRIFYRLSDLRAWLRMQTVQGGRR